MELVLEVKDLTKTFVTKGKAEFTAIDHINFQLYRGETLGIVGESGSGKSTLARVITRLLDTTEGSVFLCGDDITRKKGKKLREAYRNIQMIFQNPASSFDPRKSLGYGIGESLRNSGMSNIEAKKRVLELLEQCGLSEVFYDRYPHEVSGGECQRAAIARALAVKPQIVICDEATSALDVTVQQKIMELLNFFQKENQISYLFICHNLALVQQFCNRVLVMKEGRIVEEGTPDDVIYRPKDEYTKMLVESVF